MAKKKSDSMSFIEIILALITGGNYGLKKEIKNNPELADSINNVKGMFTDAITDLEDLDKKYSDL